MHAASGTPPRVGIPRGMLYHKYGTFWTEYLRGLGLDPVLSPETNRRIVSDGVDAAIDETCLSVKVYLGHVDWLVKNGRCDFLLVPYVASTAKGEQTCAKCWGLRDIVRNTFPDANVIGYDLDAENGDWVLPSLMRMTWENGLSRNPVRMLSSYRRGQRALAEHKAERHIAQEDAAEARGTKVLLVSHSYNTQDALIGKPCVGLLNDMGVTVVLADAMPEKEAQDLGETLSGRLYWTWNRELLGAVQHYRDRVDGIVFLVTFPCGPDSMVTDLCVRKIRDVPTMVITLDELDGTAGLRTRMESFVDILRMKKGEAVS